MSFEAQQTDTRITAEAMDISRAVHDLGLVGRAIAEHHGLFAEESAYNPNGYYMYRGCHELEFNFTELDSQKPPFGHPFVHDPQRAYENRQYPDIVISRANRMMPKLFGVAIWLGEEPQIITADVPLGFRRPHQSDLHGIDTLRGLNKRYDSPLVPKLVSLATHAVETSRRLIP